MVLGSQKKSLLIITTNRLCTCSYDYPLLGWRIKDERWKTYYFRIWNRIVKTITSLILYLSAKRSFIRWGVNFNKAEVISMHLCFQKTGAKVPLFSEIGKINLHFANSHFAKCAIKSKGVPSVETPYKVDASFWLQLANSATNITIQKRFISV